jgi:cbb3-type cytochrome oxidase maturation protein
LSVIIVLIGFSLLVALIFLIAFIWAVKSGQYEDRFTPSVRMLFDDLKSDNKNNFNLDKDNTNINDV